MVQKHQKIRKITSWKTKNQLKINFIPYPGRRRVNKIYEGVLAFFEQL